MMSLQSIHEKIYTIRDQKVMPDSDLAYLYRVETKTLNQSARRNIQRFPVDFMFQLTEKEFANLMSQNVTSSWGGTRKLPYVFTEHGVTMLAGILRSPKAIEMNILIVRAFVTLRQFAYQYQELAEKIAQLEGATQKNFEEIYTVLTYLIEGKKNLDEFRQRKRIGFTNNNR